MAIRSLDFPPHPADNRPSMRTLAFMNQKGGVGKTTTAVNVGAAMAAAGRSVCLIDVDPQAHLTIYYGLDPEADKLSLYDVLTDDRSILEAVHRVRENLAVVPSRTDLAGAEVELVTVLGRELVLRKRMEAVREHFDYLILDCAPSLGLLTINALAAADDVIIPMQPHFLALQGMAKLLETVKQVRQRMNPGLKVAGVVLTMFDGQAKLSHEVIAELDGFFAQSATQDVPWAGAKVFKTRIRRNIKLAESPSFGQPIFDYDANSNGATDYRQLAREMLETFEPAPPAVPEPAASAADAAEPSEPVANV